jgi:DNA mismatch repair protein MutL
MPRIQQLSPQVVAQIAAGEVIERPASVLKELLENSIDAGATRLDVSVGQGGLEYIRVVDDGGGIEPDDLALAFSAHATSKLRSADDLAAIATLGFRGEGLASIGSVAQVALQSRARGRDLGAEVRCHGGDLSEARPWNGAPGTRVEVRHLFYNIPARRKFLRGPATEMSHIQEVFTRIALSQLSLGLTLEHNGRKVYEVPASAGLLDRVRLFFGGEVADRLLMVEAEGSGATLGGYVADPLCERGGTQMQYLFVNGRWVRDRYLSQALQEAYRGLLLTGKHPVAFLFFEMPAGAVDVNVHPTKAEVRFRQPAQVQQLVTAAVRRRLGKEDLTAPLRPPAEEVAAVGNGQVRPGGAAGGEEKVVEPVAPPAPAAREVGASAPLAPVGRGVGSEGASQRTRETTSKQGDPAQQAPRAPRANPAPPAPLPAQRRPPRALQMHDLYLVVEVPEGVLVIDQHALHERILFEQLKRRLASGKPEVQRLLIPEPVGFPPAQAALLLEHRPALADLGLLVEDFGGGTVLLSGYPAVLGKRSPRDALRAVADYLAGKERPPTREAMLNDLLALMACHSAVRAGDRLSPEEIRELLESRHLAQDSHHCPHGRPASLLFTKHDLDRQFRRLG